MKCLIIRRMATIIFLCSLHFTVFAQADYLRMMKDFSYNFYDVVDAAEEYFSKNDKGKGSGYKQYMRWRYHNEGSYGPSGDRLAVDHRIAAKTYENYLKNTAVSTKKANQPTWKELGPYYSAAYEGSIPTGSGRVEDFWVNPTNNNEIFMSSKSGGFWKTTDEGKNWINTTDNLIAAGVNTIAVNPFDHNEVLINVQNPKNEVTHGIYRSTDRGNTWQLSNFNPTSTELGGFQNSGRVLVIKYHPMVKDLILIGTNRGVFRSDDNLFDDIDHVKNEFQSYHDIEFHPSNTDIVYLINTSLPKIWISNNQGVSFDTSTIISSPMPSPGQQIAVSPVAPDNLWYASTEGVWKSTNRGISFSFMVMPSKYMSEFCVSDVDATKQLLGFVDLYRTTTEDSLIVSTSGFAAIHPEQYIHDDAQVLNCLNGIFYAGTDGFLAKTLDNGVTWIRLNETGTAIRENYFIALSQGDNKYYATGCQDNGSSVHYKDNWHQIGGGGDGMECIIHPLNDSWLITSTQSDKHLGKENGRVRAGNRTNGTWWEPFFDDPNDPMRLISFAGNTLSVANDYQMDWQVVGDHGLGRVQSADISNQNSAVMIANYGAKIKLSTNGGQSWSDIKNNLPLTNISTLRINPNNDQVFIVATKSYTHDNEKVFISFDRGQKWDNITHDLGNMPVYSIEIDNSPQRNIYLGTELGIFTKPMYGNGSNNWTAYNKGLPNVSVMDMEIHYGSNELFAATWGRGTWKVDLVGKASYPKITSTKISDGPTNILPTVGSDQEVTCIIQYNGTLTNVELLWSDNGPSFTNKIQMVNTTGDTWVTTSPLPSESIGQRLFFKVQATGSNNDTSETYKFTYKVKDGSFINGDVNMDGTLNILDASNLSQFIVRRKIAGDCRNIDASQEICIDLADINRDDNINMLDAYQIARCAVNLPDAICPN